MHQETFIPHHINATQEDMQGNGGIGRYLLLPGSNGRAAEIASHFRQLQVVPHARGHDLYLGQLVADDAVIDVAVISTGMGGGSMEIILHELYHLGVKRFLRIGTAGSLQPHSVHMGDIVHVLGAVRDEAATDDYMPKAVPALSSFEMNHAIHQAVSARQWPLTVHRGIVHCKSTLYAREFGAGPLATDNAHYLAQLSASGVLASEMETASLFIQSMWYDHQLKQRGHGAAFRVLCGALLSIVAVPPHEWLPADAQKAATDNMALLALDVIKQLACQDRVV